MSSVLPDPDAKIYMSLDEIIKLEKGQKEKESDLRNCKIVKKKKKHPRKEGGEEVAPEHSVPLLASTGGLDIYVTKQSPLLNAENRRRIAQAVSNRAINSNLIQNAKEIIPAEYKLVKTDQGVERVLVPATEYILRPPRKKLSQPRKLNKSKSTPNLDSPDDLLPDKPPPLVTAPIFRAPSPLQGTKGAEPDVVIVEPPNCKKFEVIDVEAELPGSRDLPAAAPLSVPQSCGRTLNDRFTMLIENFHS